MWKQTRMLTCLRQCVALRRHSQVVSENVSMLHCGSSVKQHANTPPMQSLPHSPHPGSLSWSTHSNTMPWPHLPPSIRLCSTTTNNVVCAVCLLKHIHLPWPHGIVPDIMPRKYVSPRHRMMKTSVVVMQPAHTADDVRHTLWHTRSLHLTVQCGLRKAVHCRFYMQFYLNFSPSTILAATWHKRTSTASWKTS